MEYILPILLLSGLGLFFGLILGFFSKKFAVKVDKRIEKVLDMLPGANCGACGSAGCGAFAEDVINKSADHSLCAPGGEETVKEISKFLGIESEIKDKKRVEIYCNGSNDKCGLKFEYKGVEDCKAVNLIYGGNKNCSYGCLAYFSCQKACPFDAIGINKDKFPYIIKDKCVACGKCIDTCPKNLISFVSAKKKVHILCSSLDSGAIVNKACKVGCIGCRKCVKECPVEAIHMDGFLAKIDYDKCINCGKCIKVCPKAVILKEVGK